MKNSITQGDKLRALKSQRQPRSFPSCAFRWVQFTPACVRAAPPGDRTFDPVFGRRYSTAASPLLFWFTPVCVMRSLFYHGGEEKLLEANLCMAGLQTPP